MFESVAQTDNQLPLLVKSLFLPFVRFLGSSSKQLHQLDSQGLFQPDLLASLRRAVGLTRWRGCGASPTG